LLYLQIFNLDLLLTLYILVITGSSSGIGMNYAKELAKRGMNVVLMSNEEKQLHAVSKEIGRTFNLNR
jgi:uncharacterized protein